MKRAKTYLLFVGMMFVMTMLYPAPGNSRVNVNIGISVPPPFVFPAPPELVVVPGTYVYFAPGFDVDIFFYHGYWYRPYEGHWFRARSYRGPWAYSAPARVPGVLLHLPPDYRHLPPGHERIPYGQFKRNWRRWDRERYWDRHPGGEWQREERREHRERGRDRY